jgi:hypothetical protein
MDLYDVKARGFHCPLNYREISRLYRAGQFSGRQACKPKSEARWQTIDELFPLLKYEAAAPPLRFEDPPQRRRRVMFISTCALLLAFLGAAMLQVWIQSAPTTVDRWSGEHKRPQMAEPAVVPFTPTSPVTSSDHSSQALGRNVVVADRARIK